MHDPRELKIAIVAPVHVQVTDKWIQALKAITQGKSNVRVIIVDDSDGQVVLPVDWDVFDYARQEQEMGPEIYARFSRCHKSSASKNFGHWLAWRDGADVVIGLDSDCIVPPNFIGQHVEALMMRSSGWTNPLRGTGWFARGFPYVERDRPTIASLGLWENELDVYGKDRLEKGQPPARPLISGHEVADGFVPFSGMNWAAWAQAIPGLFFLPNFDYAHTEEKLFKFRRHDDIWGGYIFQKLMAIRNERVVFGDPVVFHDTVVDAQADNDDEEAMILFETAFFTAVDAAVAKVEWGMYEDMYASFADIIKEDWKNTEFSGLIEMICLWAELFNTTDQTV